MSTQNTRLLAAVMFTDIVGYTATMQEDERKANEQRDRHRQVLEERASEFEGKILHYYGDGALTIFHSAFNAVMCGIKIQQDMVEPNLPLRIGIHVGDIAYNDEDVYGNAVNIASRLESISISGGILISDKVFEEIKNHREIQTKALGIFQLKNVQEPVQIYSVSNEGINIPSSQEIKAQNREEKKRVAVLPFVNMSDELGFDYFIDGLTEEIINGLTKMRELDVTSRTSAFAFKGLNEDIRNIGQKLSVTHVLEGSVRKSKDKIRVTAQLIETGEGFHLWSETYERHLKDIFEIQDLVSQEILEKFQQDFTPPPREKAGTELYSKDQRAYKAYLEGEFEWSKWTTLSVVRAVKKYAKAIEIDSEFVKAHTALASCYVYLGIHGQVSARLAFGKAEKYANEALKLNNSSAEAHSLIGLVEAFFHNRYKKADQAFSRAFSINDKMANPYYYYFLFLNAMGKNEAAVQWMEQALALDPSNVIFNTELGRAYHCAHRYLEAMEQYDYTLQLDPTFLPAINGKGWAYVAIREYKKAHKTFDVYQNLVSHELKNIPQLVYIAARMGMDKVAQHFLEMVQLGDIGDKYISTPVDIALIYLGLRKYDEMFFHLQRALEDKIGQIMFIPSNPIWDEIRDDSRYKKLMDQLNLSEAQRITPRSVS